MVAAVKAAPERKKTPRYKGPRHVQKLPLLTNPRDEAILFTRMRVIQKLKNDVLGLLLKRADGMRHDPRWRQACQMAKQTNEQQLARHAAFDLLWAEYQLTKDDASRLGEEVRNQRGWMKEVVTVQLANKAGLEVYVGVKEWLYGKKGRPRFQPSNEPGAIWGNQTTEGLIVRDGRLIWNALTKDKRKSLSVKIDFRGLSQARQDYLSSLEVQRYGLSRECVRGHWRFFLQVSLKGEAYRNPDYLAAVATDSLIGVDPGISYMATVSQESAAVIRLVSDKELKKAQGQARYERRIKRRLQRSRQAMNPDCYDSAGRSIKGRHPRKLGKKAEHLQQTLAGEQRRQTINRKQSAHKTAQALMQRGANLAIETNSFKAFQRTWGKRMGLTAPGQLLEVWKAEAARVGGQVFELDAFTNCLSQYCLCGDKRKKDRSETVHHCSKCGLGPLDRNLFSAFLAYLIVQEGWPSLSEAAYKLAGLIGYREEAIRLCSVEPVEVVTPTSAASLGTTQASYGSTQSSRATGRLAEKPVVQTPREYQATEATPLLDTSRPADTYFSDPCLVEAKPSTNLSQRNTSLR